MQHNHPILVTGAAGRSGAIGPAVTRSLLDRGFRVRAMVRREDDRSAALRRMGAEIVSGNLLDLHDLHRAVEGCRRVYFSMSVDPSYLEATANMAAVCRDHGIDAFVNMSQMTVSQMNIRETTDSPQHKQHWLAEQALRWSGLPVVYMRPTVFMDVFFLQLCAPTIRRDAAISLPFGSGRTSPIAAADVARCVTEVLAEPAPHLGLIYELTGPSSESMEAIAEQYSRALGRRISYVDAPVEQWEEAMRRSGLPPHLVAHLITMADLHRRNRYDRLTGDVEKLTGTAPISILEFVRAHAAVFEPEPATKAPSPGANLRYLDEFTPGQRFASGGLAVDRDRIKKFAAEFDPQPFHLDDAAARDSMFRGLAASGWHTAAMTMRLLVDSDLRPAGGIIGIGFDEFRWPNPVRDGDSLHLEIEVLDVRPSRSQPDQGVLKLRTTTLNQKNEAVQVSVGNLLVRRQADEAG